MTRWSLLHQHSCGKSWFHYNNTAAHNVNHVVSLLRTRMSAPAPWHHHRGGELSTTCRSSFQFIRRQYVEPEPELIPQRCSHCGGTGKCTCADCGGRGRLSRAGYNKKNRVDMTRVVGSKWTAMKETLGWRHFRVIQCRKGGSSVVFVQMQASCDPATQLWINATNLKDRDLWAAGWLQKSEMEDPAGAMAGGVTCRACSGAGSTPCPVCDATGAVLLPPSGLGAPAEAMAGPSASAGATVGVTSSSSSSSTGAGAGGSGGVSVSEPSGRLVLSSEETASGAMAGSGRGTAGGGGNAQRESGQAD